LNHRQKVEIAFVTETLHLYIPRFGLSIAEYC
jgi:hypothetical protein